MFAKTLWDYFSLNKFLQQSAVAVVISDQALKFLGLTHNQTGFAISCVGEIKIPFGVVINRSDIGDGKVEEYCGNENISILMKIPFSREIAVSYSEGIPIVEKDVSYQDKFISLYLNICGIKNEANSRH